MRAETIAGLVVVFRRSAVIVENPLRMLRAAGPVHQMADLGFFIPETADAASVAAFAPEHGVDVRIAIERGKNS